MTTLSVRRIGGAVRAARAAAWIAAIALWLAAVSAGMVALWRYKSTPGSEQAFPSRWPENTALRRDEGRPTLLVFLHPRCPCSRATVAELRRLTGLVKVPLNVQAIFQLPAGADDEFARTELWRQVREVPGVAAVKDWGGTESRRFGALTSGQTLLYGADGELRFAGGITTARGHEGRAPGTDRILAVLAGAQPARSKAPVFGCEL